MKKNKHIQTLVLIAVLAVIAVVYWMDAKQIKQKEEQEQKEKVLVALDQSEVGSVSLVNENGTFKAVKEGDGWKMVEPFATMGDKSLWDNLARNYSNSKRQRIIKENADDLSVFGLDTPQIQVTVAGATNAVETTLLIGDETPVSGKYYALIKGSSDVVTVGSSLQTTANKTLFQLRDKTVVAFQTDDVQRIEVQTEPITYTVERKGDDKWIITEPTQGLADESKLRTFLNKIKGAEIKQFIDEDPEMLASYGLAEPATKVVFWTGKPGNEASWSSRALMFGDVSESENVYTKRDGEKNVFEISPNELNDMPLSWNDLRKSKISNMRTWNVQRFTVASAGDVILEASKESSEWYLQQPQQGKANYSSVSDVLRGIVELEASEFVEGATQDYGLDHPDLVFNLYGDEGDETISLAKSEDSNDPTSQAMYYGARKDPLEIYAIRSGAIRLLMDKISQVKVTKPAGEPKPEPTENEQ